MRWLDRLFGKKTARRAYAGAKGGRLMFTASEGSANSELYTGLRTLRNRSRQLARDVVYAKRAKSVVVNNVIGQGIGLQAQIVNQRGRMIKQINDAIEAAWEEWSCADTCHTGGELHMGDFERAAMFEVFEAGEVFIRLHPRPFGRGRIPLALELIEADRIADDWEIKAPSGAAVTMGIEHDAFHRPVAYYIHTAHPRETQTTQGKPRDDIVRVPADQIIHLRIVERWPQVRGVPWLHAAITRLNQLGEYEEAAVIAARIGASKVGWFENPEGQSDGLDDGQTENDTPTFKVEAGEVGLLPAGWKFSSWDPNYPTEAFDPFTRACLRGIAAGIGVSYESLSRDYSQSNYSSSRLSLLDDRDAWRVLQQWWIRNFRQPLHGAWLQAAVLSRAVPVDVMDYAANPAKYAAVKFKPRGWGWVDPAKEVAAYKEAERAGYITKTDIIAATAGGQDIEDVVQTRRRELDMLEEYDIETDTTQVMDAAPEPAGDPAGADPSAEDDAPPAKPARIIALKRDHE